MVCLCVVVCLFSGFSHLHSGVSNKAMNEDNGARNSHSAGTKQNVNIAMRLPEAETIDANQDPHPRIQERMSRGGSRG